MIEINQLGDINQVYSAEVSCLVSKFKRLSSLALSLAFSPNFSSSDISKPAFLPNLSTSFTSAKGYVLANFSAPEFIK